METADKNVIQETNQETNQETIEKTAISENQETTLTDITNEKAIVKIDGEEYELFFSVRAVKEITTRYGNLEKFGEMLFADDFDSKFPEIIWLTVLLSNQAILKYNYKNPEAKKQLVTEEMIEILTRLNELKNYVSAILKSMAIGMGRTVESESDAKNGQGE